MLLPENTQNQNMRDSKFFPHEIHLPQVSLRDNLKQALQDIVTLLARPSTPTVSSLQEGDPVRIDLLYIST